MIAKITRGTRAGDIAAYLHGPGKANEHQYTKDHIRQRGGVVIGGNLGREGETDGTRWAQDLRAAAHTREDITKPIWQVSLRTAPGDRKSLVLLGARPVRILLMSPRTRGDQPASARLPRPSRWMTVVVGVLVGVPVAAAPVPMLSAAAMLVVSAPVLVSVLATRSRFSFQRLGLQWGTWQWAGYGASATIIFGYAACIAFGVGVSFPVGVTMSAFVAAATAVTALAPASRR